MADVDAALEQQVLDIAQRQRTYTITTSRITSRDERTSEMGWAAWSSDRPTPPRLAAA
jgi:hypothetical protein